MDDEHEARAGSAHRPLEHLLVPIRISKCSDGTAANKNLDADRFALFVIDELHFGQSEKHRLPIVEFVLHFAAATDDLLRRNAVRLFGKATHELNATARNDESFEFVCAQI